LENGVFGEVLKAYRIRGEQEAGSRDEADVKEAVTIRAFRENHKSLDELDLSELDAISQLNHENVVRLFDMVWRSIYVYVCTVGLCDKNIVEFST